LSFFVSESKIGNAYFVSFKICYSTYETKINTPDQTQTVVMCSMSILPLMSLASMSKTLIKSHRLETLRLLPAHELNLT